MEQEAVHAFNTYLGLEMFRGSSSKGIEIIIAGGDSLTNAARTIQDLLINRSRTEGREGLKKMLDTLALGMTNA